MSLPLAVAAVLLQAGSQPWWLGPLALLFLVGFATAGYLLWSRRRRLDAKHREDDWDEESSALPPLIFPPRPAPPASAEPPRPAGAQAAPPTAENDLPEAGPPAGTEDAGDTDTPVADSLRIAPIPIRFSLLGTDAEPRTESPAGAPPRGTTAPTDPGAAPAQAGSPPQGAPPAADDQAEHDSSTAEAGESTDADATVPASAGPVRFHRPADGTLQLLPGRLEVLDQAHGVHEIRFVRPAGRDPVVTFGRTPGEPLAHVQLDAPTVSRMHARMHFAAGEWRIVNLSHTNPVVVNGVRLNGDTASDGRLLEDGDVVEMGEVSFRFRMP